MEIMMDWEYEQKLCWCGHRKRYHEIDMCLKCHTDYPDKQFIMHSWHPEKKFNAMWGFHQKGKDQYTEYLEKHPQ